MIVYVESNFVLEVALGQEQAPSAEAILAKAETGEIHLAFPEFALTEPFSTITYQGRQRRSLSNSLSDQLRQLERSVPHQEVVSLLRPAPTLLGEIERREIDLLESTVDRMLKIGRPLNLNEINFQLALVYKEQYELSPQDAIIYSVILTDIKEQPNQEIKYFISLNWKDFGRPAIRSELRTYNCQYLESFDNALTLIRGS